MTEEELQALLERTTPAHERYELFVEECQDEEARLRFSLPAGQAWSIVRPENVATPFDTGTVKLPARSFWSSERVTLP